MGDLAASFRQGLAVNQFDKNRDMACLDDVENVFPKPVHYSAGQAKAGNAAPSHRGCAELVIPEGANAPADPDTGAGGQNIGQCDSEIDGGTQEHERQCSAQQSESLSDIEIPHGSGSFWGNQLEG